MTTPPRRHMLLTVAAAASLAAGLSVAAHRVFMTPAAQPATAITVFAGIMLLALPARRRLHPFATFGAANVVTTLRGALVAVAAGFIMAPAAVPIAWVLVLLAALSITLDGADGWLARRTGLSSPFGARFDMEVDALFLLVLSILVWRYQKAGAWVIAIGLMRYAFVGAGLWFPFMTGPLTPTLRGKAVAVLQMVVLSLAIVPLVPPPLSAAVCFAALVTLVWSFTIDIRRLYMAQAGRPGEGSPETSR